MGAVVIEPVSCGADNYSYLVVAPAAGGVSEALVVDPSQAAPVLAALRRTGARLRGILFTHHHSDHVGGAAELGRVAGGSVWVAGRTRDGSPAGVVTSPVDPARERFVAAGLDWQGPPLVAMHVPGHTRSSVAWGIARDREALTPTDVFTGDTLFGAGCGRLFEGTAADMHASLRALCALPPATRLWFGHEYTAENLRFAATVEPGNAAVGERAARLTACTTPTTVELELATNPFVRARSVDELARRRADKDRF